MGRGQDDARSPEGSEAGYPIDVAALRADDDLIEALAAGRSAPADRSGHDDGPDDDPDDELVAMLAAWVAEVRPGAARQPDRPEIPPAFVLPDVIPVSTIHRTPPPAPGRHRAPAMPSARRLTAAAALVVLAASGLAVKAWDADRKSVV